MERAEIAALGRARRFDQYGRTGLSERPRKTERQAPALGAPGSEKTRNGAPGQDLNTSLKLQALISWLTAGAPPQTDYSQTVAELARRIVDAGVDADMIALYQTPKNPMLGGKRYMWTRERGMEVRPFSHTEMRSAYFVGNVIERARTLEKPIRYRVGQTPEYDTHIGSKAIIARGFSEMVALPLLAISQSHSVLAVAVKRRGGLEDTKFDILRRVAAPLARVAESNVRHEEARNLLATYLGQDAGNRVNAGMIERGDATMIRAIILFTDIVGFTELSNRLEISETVDLLNRYFEALEKPVLKNGGEILKLIGDGMLAIFPAKEDLTAEEGAALSALSSVEDARATMKDLGITFRAAFHFGEIHYGNIGGLTRLDFTAIGPAVNLAARLLGTASEQNLPGACSEEFARLAPDHVAPLGSFQFKGFSSPCHVFTPATEPVE